MNEVEPVLARAKAGPGHRTERGRRVEDATHNRTANRASRRSGWTAARLGALIAVACAGCATAPPPVIAPPPEPPKVNEEAEEALAVLADLQKLALANPDEQKREMAAATQLLARQKSDAVRLRLGMLQSLPAGGADESRALATLEPVLKQGNGPTRMVAAVLMAQLTERQRAVREEKKRSDDLQQKLDALKALERSLLGRERKP